VGQVQSVDETGTKIALTDGTELLTPPGSGSPARSAPRGHDGGRDVLAATPTRLRSWTLAVASSPRCRPTSRSGPRFLPCPESLADLLLRFGAGVVPPGGGELRPAGGGTCVWASAAATKIAGASIATNSANVFMCQPSAKSRISYSSPSLPDHNCVRHCVSTHLHLREYPDSSASDYHEALRRDIRPKSECHLSIGERPDRQPGGVDRCTTLTLSTHDTLGGVAERLTIDEIPKCSEIGDATPGDSIDTSYDSARTKPSKIIAPGGRAGSEAVQLDSLCQLAR
jgi:hypothetical protein